ncbi:MAG: ROK family protein [Peptostreptococcaceae bacterium]|nr:ROK family protein [Peptostreptococcaceae bacterium]
MVFLEEDYLIGVDLGGTKAMACLLKGSNIIKKNQRLLPGAESTAEEITQLLIDVIANVFDEKVKGIGIGVPSLIDREKGIVFDVQNIPAWGNIPLRNILEKRFKVPVYMNNDANCFTLGEFRFGKHDRKIKNFVGLTLGTGMGAGIINKGYLLSDAHCGSGEFGSTPYLDGILEDYCSGKFFQNYYGESGEIIGKQAKEGNHSALKSFDEFGKHLGIAVKTILFTLDPSMIVIGGSVAKSHSFFEKTMWEQIRSFPYPKVVDDLCLKFITNGKNAILGAASLYYDEEGK